MNNKKTWANKTVRTKHRDINNNDKHNNANINNSVVTHIKQ